MRALDRAEQALNADLPKYLPLWQLAVPAEFENFHPWDFSKFGRGEQFVNETLPREKFDDVFDMVERWGLDQFVKDRSPETLTYGRNSPPLLSSCTAPGRAAGAITRSRRDCARRAISCSRRR